MASQCAHPGLSENWATVEVTNAISGLVPIAAYINEPMASRYGTFFIFAISSSLLGLCDFDNGAEGSMGIDEGLRSLKLN